MKRLSVNIDHVATLRQARLAAEPDPIFAAVLVELAGADGITVHLREDRRHIQDRDVRLLKEILHIHLNLEMAATDEMISIATSIKPNLVTLVPEKRQELTTEGGLDVLANKLELKKSVSQLKKAEILVSLFVDPLPEQIQAAKETGADFVELHTGVFCEIFNKNPNSPELKNQLQLLIEAAKLAKSLNLRVNAGHGLNYHNIWPLLQIGEIEEFSIGHSIIARAVLVGLTQAVKEMLAIIRGHSSAIK